MGTHNTPTPTDPDQLAENTQHALDLLCQHLRNNLIKRFTMSDLEELSGLSARTLQYQFKNQFGCSPMRWIAQQRLDACQERFLTGPDGDSVTAWDYSVFSSASVSGRYPRKMALVKDDLERVTSSLSTIRTMKESEFYDFRHAVAATEGRIASEVLDKALKILLSNR